MACGIITGAGSAQRSWDVGRGESWRKGEGRRQDRGDIPSGTSDGAERGF